MSIGINGNNFFPDDKRNNKVTDLNSVTSDVKASKNDSKRRHVVSVHNGKDVKVERKVLDGQEVLICKRGESYYEYSDGTATREVAKMFVMDADGNSCKDEAFSAKCLGLKSQVSTKRGFWGNEKKYSLYHNGHYYYEWDKSKSEFVRTDRRVAVVHTGSFR